MSTIAAAAFAFVRRVLLVVAAVAVMAIGGAAAATADPAHDAVPREHVSTHTGCVVKRHVVADPEKPWMHLRSYRCITHDWTGSEVTDPAGNRH